MVKRAVFLLILLLPILLAAQDGTTVIRVFTLDHVPAEEIITLIRPLLSPQGSMTLNSKTNSIAIKDHATQLEAVAQFIQAVDQPPRSFKISIKMIQATTTPSAPSSISEEIQGVGHQLQAIFPYQNYDVIAQNIIEGLSGDVVSYRLNEAFHVDFYLYNPVRLPNVIQLKNFRLFRVIKKGNEEILQPILRTTINLQVDQNHIVGVSNSIKNSKALIFILRATPS